MSPYLMLGVKGLEMGGKSKMNIKALTTRVMNKASTVIIIIISHCSVQCANIYCSLID